LGSPWKAVADDSRRQILILLSKGEKTPGEIATNFPFTLPALSIHLKVLKEAGLVSERRIGKNRIYSVNPERMSEMAKFFDVFWDGRLANLKKHVEGKEKRGQ
jgi:DNA-binding transcriptional ArsR family regulator